MNLLDDAIDDGDLLASGSMISAYPPKVQLSYDVQLSNVIVADILLDKGNGIRLGSCTRDSRLCELDAVSRESREVLDNLRAAGDKEPQRHDCSKEHC